jgi:hypothetical protein
MATLTKLQRFTPMRVHRSQINLATYNPRTIDVYARKRLKENIKKNGLIEALVWNEATANLVGGHQRIHEMDELEGNTDYLLDVCAINEPDLQTEKLLNVVLNNPAFQGAYDTEALGRLFDEFSEDFEGAMDRMGFDRMELETLFDEERFSKFFGDDKTPPEISASHSFFNDVRDVRNGAAREQRAADRAATDLTGIPSSVPDERNANVTNDGGPGDSDEPIGQNDVGARLPQKSPEQIAQEMRDKKREYRERKIEEDDTEYILVVVCQSRAQSEELNLALGLDAGEKYADGNRLLAILKAAQGK